MIEGIWIVTGVLYLAFYAWYVGFRGKLTPAEVDHYCHVIGQLGVSQESVMRKVFGEDNGHEFFMVNLLKIRRQLPSGESGRDVLMKYQKPFLGSLLRRAGHPIAMVMSASPAVECWGIENASDWDAAVLVRYRSRRDLAEIVSTPMFRDQHPYKLQAVEKTFAFVGDPARIIIGGPKLVVPLLLFAVASALSFLLG